MIDREILHFILSDPDLFRMYFNSIKPEYFMNKQCMTIFKHVQNYFETLRCYPTIDSVEIEYKSTVTNGFDKQAEEILAVFGWMKSTMLNVDQTFKRTTLEGWIKQSSLRCAIYSSAEILNSKIPDYNKVFSVIKESVSISFDKDYGLSFHDLETKKKFYSASNPKYPFRLDEFNKITMFGAEEDCLHIIVAGMGVGKSRALISIGCDYVRSGYDVIYFTMEMKASQIMKRVDANLLQTDIKFIGELVESGNSEYMIRHSQVNDMDRIGHFIVKHMKCDNTTVNDIRFFYEDFINNMPYRPKIVLIDYIGTMTPNRGPTKSMYEDGKKISSEMRSFIEEFHLVGFSASQANTEGIKNIELSLSNIGESRAVGHVADDVWGAWDDPDCPDGSRQVWKILKTRYSEYKNYKFYLGVIRSQFRLVNYDDNFQSMRVGPVVGKPVSGSMGDPVAITEAIQGDASHGMPVIKFNTDRRQK